MDERDDPPYARAPEPDDLVRICRSLNESGARYVLIGGFAVIAYGATRFTKDIDLLVDDDPENVSRVKRALSVLADNAAADMRDTDVRDHVVVRVADEVASRVADEFVRNQRTGAGSLRLMSFVARDAYQPDHG